MSKIGWKLVIVFVILLSLGYVSTRITLSHRKVRAAALIGALQRLYDATIVTNQTGSVCHDLALATVRQRLLNKLEATSQVLPSFVGTSDLYVTQQTMPIQSNDVFLVIKVTDKLIYAITADRHSKALSLEEFDAWPHEGLHQSGQHQETVRQPGAHLGSSGARLENGN